ncbi:MAG: ABC transporter permease [Myxococcota bacterium]
MTSARLSGQMWRQFLRRGPTRAALGCIGVLLAAAVLAPLIASDQPFLWKDASGWSMPWVVSLFDRNVFENEVDLFFNAILFPGLPLGAVSLLARRRWVSAVSAAVWLVAFAWVVALGYSSPVVDYATRDGSGVFAPFPFSYRAVNLQSVRLEPSWTHWLGTDNAGRDVAVRLLFGTRISLTVGLVAVFLYASVGTVLGAVAGYYGGWVDAFIQRAIEVVLAIPSLFLILTVAAFIDNRSIFHIMLIIAAVEWTTPARLVRAEVLRLRNLDFVSAARASGLRESEIIFRHILPNATGPVFVAATFGVAAAILIESTMSFLGLGDITVPSWGQILNTGRSTGLWTLILAPGLAIFVTVGALNLLGDGLRDALDPKLRGGS